MSRKNNSMNNAKTQLNMIANANAMGFPVAEFIPIPPLKEWENEVNWRIQHDGLDMDEWKKDCPENNPFDCMPSAKSIFMVAWPMPPFKDIPATSLACSSYYIDNKKYRQLLSEIENMCKENGVQTVLANNLPIKPIVAASGIGEYGRQGLIHFKNVGTFVRISLFLTNLVIEKKPIFEYNKVREQCVGCNLCINACPVKAIGKDGHVNRSICIRQYMLSGKIIPRDYRNKMGTSLVGCEECQRVCPDNVIMIENAMMPNKDYIELFDIEAILKESQTSLKKRIAKMKEVIGANYARALRVLSAAIIAAGNTKDKHYLPYLYKTIFHQSEVISTHSVWAIAKIGGKEAWDFLDKKEQLLPVKIQKVIKIERKLI